MKKSIFPIAFLIMLLVTSYSQPQTCSVIMKAKNEFGTPVQIDSVRIHNVTQDWYQTVVSPDTVVEFPVLTGIPDVEKSQVMHVAPNPSKGSAQVSFFHKNTGYVRIWLVDMQGKTCAQYSRALSEGYHSFNVTMSRSQMYVLHLKTKDGEYSAKLINLGECASDRIVYDGFSDGLTPVSYKKDRSFEVQLGDEMRLVGYTNKEGVPIVGSYHVMSLSEQQTLEMLFNTSGAACPEMPLVTDHEGNVYNTVQIGSQCWLKENLRTTSYDDGTSISQSPTTDSHAFYRLAPGGEDSTVATCGYLYNWSAAVRRCASCDTMPDGVRGICPVGWHIPSLAECELLFNTINVPGYQCGSDSGYLAQCLTGSYMWDLLDPCDPSSCSPGYLSGVNNTNATGFSIIPCGYYDADPTGWHFMDFGFTASFWCSTNSHWTTSAYALYSVIEFCEPEFGIYGTHGKTWAHPVRCVRD